MEKYLTKNGDINLNSIANDFIPHQSKVRLRASGVSNGKELYKLMEKLIEGQSHPFYVNYSEEKHSKIKTIFESTATIKKGGTNFRLGT